MINLFLLNLLQVCSTHKDLLGRDIYEKYMELIGELRNKLNFLADKIKPKIYEYGFLKE